MSENDIELKITADTSSISTLTENDFTKFIKEMNKYKKHNYTNTATYQWVAATPAPHYVELEPEPIYNKHWA